MDWLLPFRPPADGCASDPGLPRRLLRHVLRCGRISIGSRVLVAGSGANELARYLDEMAIDATALDGMPGASGSAPPPALQRAIGASCAATVPLWEHAVDAVLSRETPGHRGDLLGLGALRATARLAARLLPRGNLILLSRFDPKWSTQPGGHLESCYRYHLESLPGTCQVSYLADPFASRSTWNWMLGRQPRSGFVIATLAVPAVRIPRGEWERVAAEAALRRTHACCAWSAEGAQELKSAA